MISLLPYIGGKHRLADEIAKRLHATGADTLIDVFGGSAAVTLNAGFAKRVYNDIDGDLVNLFSVIADSSSRRRLLEYFRYQLPSREIYDRDGESYFLNGFSFSYIRDPVARARATLFRQLFAFGGKNRSGGFQVSTGNRGHIKEVRRMQNISRKIRAVGTFFRATVIENLDYQRIIELYGKHRHHVLFCDPPYDGTEHYYARGFRAADHVFLAHQLARCEASVVCTYYDTPLVRDLYPATQWQWDRVITTRNSQFTHGNKPKSAEIILSRKVRIS